MKGLVIMTQMRKSEILSQILMLINEIAEDNPASETTTEPHPDKVEMLTIKECTEVIHGLSEHTVRQLVAQGKIPYIRAGQGSRGKILINKADLIKYFGSNSSSGQ